METKTDTNDGVTVQQYHETEECPKRVVSCPRNCMEWVCFEILDKHMNELCTKRPAKPIYCRLGCNCSFGGLVEKLIEAEDERLMHETEECEYRMVRCNWQYDGTHLLTHSLTHSLTYLLTHSLTHSLTSLLTHS